jgi:hypothetical protein
MWLLGRVFFGEGERKYVQIYCGEPGGKRKLGRPKLRPNYSTEVDVIGIGWEDEKWTD